MTDLRRRIVAEAIREFDLVYPSGLLTKNNHKTLYRGLHEFFTPNKSLPMVISHMHGNYWTGNNYLYIVVYKGIASRIEYITLHVLIITIGAFPRFPVTIFRTCVLFHFLIG